MFTTRRFINPYRLLIGRAALDVVFTLDHADDALDAARHQRTAASAIPLHCVAVDVDQAAAVLLSELHCVEDLRAALLASTRMPWVGGPPVPFRGRRFLDGGLAESIPYRTAVALGATHVLVLQTRPHGVGVEPVASICRSHHHQAAPRAEPRAAGPLSAPDCRYDHAVAEFAAGTDAPQPDGPFLYGLRLPAGSPVVGRFERCAGALEAAGRAAREHAERVLRGAAASGGPDARTNPGGRQDECKQALATTQDVRRSSWTRVLLATGDQAATEREPDMTLRFIIPHRGRVGRSGVTRRVVGARGSATVAPSSSALPRSRREGDTTMVEGQSMTTVADVVAQVRDGRLEDFVREAVVLVARELMEAEISAEIGAELGEVAPEARSTHRNGYRTAGVGDEGR